MTPADTLAFGPGLCTTAYFLCATQRAGCCHVDGLLPYIKCYGLLAVSQADSWLLSLEQRQPLVPLTPPHQWVSRHCRCCGRLPVAPTRAPLARCRWLRPRHLAREAPRLCLVETALPSPEGVLLLREAPSPITSAFTRRGGLPGSELLQGSRAWLHVCHARVFICSPTDSTS